MKSGENLASWIGFILVPIAVAITWWINPWLGVVCTIIAAAALVWYRSALKGGKIYLEELATRLGCRYEDWGLGFGRVTGVYRGHGVEVAVNKDYDSMIGLTGFTLSSLLMESTMGSLAGISNFASVKVQHRGLVVEPYSLDEDSFVDRGLILYLPPSGADGIPQLTVDEMVAKIEELVELAGSLDIGS